jgi:hypothetical protein
VLKLRIEEDAHVTRQQKRTEFGGWKARYEQLMQAYDSRICDKDDVLVNAINGLCEYRHPRHVDDA